MESRISDLEDKLPTLIAESYSTTRLAHDNRDKADDIENRLRCNNVCIVGLTEKVEGRDSNEFVEKCLLDTFGHYAFTPLFVVVRAYHIPTRALLGNMPRPVLARLLHYSDREKELCLARERPNNQYNRAKVSFYPDFSAEVHSN